MCSCAKAFSPEIACNTRDTRECNIEHATLRSGRFISLRSVPFRSVPFRSVLFSSLLFRSVPFAPPCGVRVRRCHAITPLTVRCNMRSQTVASSVALPRRRFCDNYCRAPKGTGRVHGGNANQECTGTNSSIFSADLSDLFTLSRHFNHQTMCALYSSLYMKLTTVTAK